VGRLPYRQATLNQLLDSPQDFAFFNATKRESFAGGSRTRGTADPVHVAFGIDGQVEVDDM
jgi:hypothetical protein